VKSTRRIDQILDAAEELISEKGLVNSSLAAIARRAQLRDTLIYNYFKGKEDILFSIPERRMKDVLRTLEEQLMGIVDPLSKLSKMIWFHLNYNDTHRGYARLLLLECRSNMNFYHHAAYSLIRKYAGIMIGILEGGVKKGVFRDDVNMRLVRDAIFGLLDLENLGVLAAQETKQSTTDFEDILDLIVPMISAPPNVKTGGSDKRIRILRAAEKAFAEKGYIQATISEVAMLAKVSEGTIYEYFRNKEDLLLSIPEERFNEHVNSLAEIFEIKSPLRKLRRLIRYHFLLYMTEQNFLKVFLLHVQLNRRFYSTHVYQTFQRYTQTITDVLEEGKKQGSIRKRVNNRVFRNLFLGAFSHMALRWFILGKDEKTDKMKEIDEVVSLLCRSVGDARQEGEGSETD
jgi:TetR/AcrR family fatty acid metabolism transcriptional regulator